MIATISPDSPKGPYNVVMEVTPDLAFEWLEGNTHNRAINQAYVNRLARDIKAGRWQVTHQGIAFDTDGLLIDGQHRLWAIVEAGIPVSVRVFFNEPPENRHVLDCGQRRSNLDILTITGQVGEISARHLATLRAMLAGPSSRSVQLTPGEEAGQYRQHRKAIEFAIEHLGSAGVRGLATAEVRAVIARAWYSAKQADLIRFCDILRSGMAAGVGDTAIAMLRDFLIRTRADGKGESVRRLRYGKAEWALSAYLDGKLPKRLYGATSELFPLPEEVEEAA